MNRARFERNPLVWVILAGLLVLVGSTVALAQESRLGGKVRAGDEVVVPVGETVWGDLYASGGLVRVEGTVDGDLVAAGGQIEVSGEVTGDLMAASGTLDISGRVGGDARFAAGQVSIGGSVGEDVFAASGQMTITSSGEVGEDLIFGTGQTTVDGRVEGDVLGATGAYERRGTVGGTEEVTITRRAEPAPPTLADRLLGGLRRYLSLLAVAALLLLLVPRVLNRVADTMRRRPLASLGVGVLGIVGFALGVLATILVVVLLSIGLGLAGLGDLVGVILFGVFAALLGLGFLFFLTLAFGAQAGIGLFLGGLATGTEPAIRRWAALALGLLVVVVVSSIPIVGGLLSFVIAVFGLGAAILVLNPWRRREPRPA